MYNISEILKRVIAEKEELDLREIPKSNLFLIPKKTPASLLRGSDLTFLKIIIGFKIRLLLKGNSKPPPK